MKIIQVTPAYKPAFIYGGPTMSVAKLCEALVGLRDETKVELEVFTTTANGKNELPVESGKKVNIDGVPVTYFRRLTKDHTHFSPALLWALRKEIKCLGTTTNKPSNQLLIHIHSWWNLVAIFSCLIAKTYSIPVVLSPRGMLTNYTQNNKNSFIKLILHYLLGKSLLKYCHVIASSEQEQRDVLQIIQPKSISILPNLVTLNEKLITHNPQPITRNPFRLLFLSRIEEKKGLDILLEALAQLTIPWTLSIAGKGEDQYVESLKQKVESLKLNNNIKWIGQINNQDKFELMAQHDLLVLTSYNENFANVVIESLSVGTAVLLSEKVGLSNYIIEKRLGYVTTLNLDDIANEIRTAYLEKENRQRIRIEGPKIIYDDFNHDVLIQGYLNLYKKVINDI